jgi:hypothetical protein
MTHSPEYAGHEHGERLHLDRRGWRPILGELWSALALEGSPADARELQRWGTRTVRRCDETLTTVLRAGPQARGTDRDACLWCAAAVLEVGARAAAARGGGGRERSVLLRLLEEALASNEREVASGERGYELPVAEVAARARDAGLALEGIGAAVGRRGTDALGRAAAALAAVAVRAAQNLDACGTASGAPANGPEEAEIAASVLEVLELAHRLRLARAHLGGPAHSGAWLSEALLARPRASTLRCLEAAPGGSEHRVNALGELRESWRQLAARLVLVLRELDRQGPRAARCPRRRLAAEVIGGAAERVRRGRLGDPRRRFDQSAAWETQLDALCGLVEEHAGALRGDPRSARERVRGRLERACAALWATDVELAALGRTTPSEERRR